MQFSLRQLLLVEIGFGSTAGIVAHFWSYKWVLVVLVAALSGCVTYVATRKLRSVALAGAACATAAGAAAMASGFILFPIVKLDSPNHSVVAFVGLSAGMIVWYLLSIYEGNVDRSPRRYLKWAGIFLLLGSSVGFIVGVFFVSRYSNMPQPSSLIPFILLWMAAGTIAAVPCLLLFLWATWLRVRSKKSTDPKAR